MKIIGLTGNIASGKSTVENIIKDKGYKIIDADDICHEILENNKQVIEQIKLLFKDFDVLNSDKSLNRAKIGEIVFFENQYKSKLESILHPVIKEEINNFINKNNNEKMIFISVPLLFEAKMENMFDKIIFVKADEKIRLQRLLKRNSYTIEQAQKRIDAQIKEEEKIKLSDYVIENNLSTEDLQNNTEKILALLS